METAQPTASRYHRKLILVDSVMQVKPNETAPFGSPTLFMQPEYRVLRAIFAVLGYNWIKPI